MSRLNQREDLEQWESQSLAPYALRSAESRGRLHPEAEPRHRTAFQRDRDRIIHSEAFRKLEYKTQVFVNDEGDYFRTRLTHTLEVVQIGRTLARALAANEDLTETICLAHDLGHPPFGHAGEGILAELLAGHGGFNHNLHSYRIVTELEQRYPQWPGLNLTIEALEGIARHETSYDERGFPGIDNADLRGSLEAQIANVADELAYNAHDLDDGLHAGLLTPTQLNELALWRELCQRMDWHEESMDVLTRHRFIRELIGWQLEDVLAESAKALDALNPRDSMAVQAHPAAVVGHSRVMRQRNDELHEFLLHAMYRNFRVMRMQQRARRFIVGIFETVTEEPHQLPPEYQRQLGERALPSVVGDYIAGLTDRSAVLEYRRLYDPLMQP
ncbi:MAG: deoxyguanosinetriphosphate triphosphohydrolase [Anaerolineaceae bacterium]|nr:deoxyguanosinetriphosphate triphosphohydrolase [Chloroflexota bacterium]MCY4010159.1 deoxyguanosinetriphosphate triphosphohydrolase [Anaerolineaceae bacterium]